MTRNFSTSFLTEKKEPSHIYEQDFFPLKKLYPKQNKGKSMKSSTCFFALKPFCKSMHLIKKIITLALLKANLKKN